MRWWLVSLLTCSTLLAQRVEIFEDWTPNSVGDAAFARPSDWPIQYGSHFYSMRLAFEERGYFIRYWDLAAHRSWLVRWRQISSWNDLKHWLGFDRKNALDEETQFVFFTGIGPQLRDLALENLPKEKLILFIWEPPTVQPEAYELERQKAFHRIYTFDDDLVDHQRYFKFYLPYLKPRISRLVPYEERNFLVLIASQFKSKYAKELYSEREKLIRFFEEHPNEPFDLFGRHWEKKKFQRWKGVIADKMEVLKNYRFAIAYENSCINGYITEKLWDCFAAGVVPIYWGADNITDYVPEDCFIDRRKFKSNEELMAFLKKMTRKEWERYVQKAGEYLKSDMAKRFTEENYARQMVDATRS